jgi:inhibitor of cysteine peptidase
MDVGECRKSPRQGGSLVVERLARSGNIIVVLIAVFAWISGCGTSRDVTVVSDDVKVSLSDDGSQVALEPGQVLAVTLEANPTTGYWWEVAQVEASILEQMGAGVYHMDDTEDPPPPGTGGVKIYRFKAVGAGQTTLELALRGSGEADEEPLQTFSLRVVVGAGE